MKLARVSPARGIGPHALAKRILGEDAIRMVPPSEVAGRAMLSPWLDRHLILVRIGLTPTDERFAVAQQLAEYVVRDERVHRRPELTARVAAAVLIPLVRLKPLMLTTQGNLTILSRHFGVSETCTALRIAEAFRRPTLVVCPARVRVRGDHWPDDTTIRMWDALRCPPGLRKAKLADAPNRTLFSVA